MHRVQRTAGLVLLFLSLAMIGLLARVVQLQSSPPQPIDRLIHSQVSRANLPGRRGPLLDRRGRVLACTRVAQRLFVDPRLVEDPNTFSEHVAYTLGYDPAEIEKRINRRATRRYVVIDERLSDARVEMLAGVSLRGLATEARLVRDYPCQSLAGQVIGFVGKDGHGLEGLELMLNDTLDEAVGTMRYLRDARHNPLWVERSAYKPPTDGRSVRVSLDVMIQFYAEAQLQATCEQFEAESGQMTVLDPMTGKILAMANYPPFDPAQFSATQPENRRNRCVTDMFEPGSTFKAILWAAATEAGLADIDEVIDCTEAGYYVSPQRRALRDAHGHGKLTWEQVLVKSSNIGMAIVGQRMSPQQMHGIVRSFGFGSTTGSQLPGEATGIVTPLRRWNHYSMTSVPMGQEMAVTSLQMLRAYASIANGGYLVTPTPYAITESSDSLDQPTVRIYERVLSPQTADLTRRVLHRVVTEGTGRKANSDRYAVFGKTGTAQIADQEHGGYLPNQYVSSFVGGAPLEMPRLIIACVIHRPNKSKGYYGGIVAAPAAKIVLEQSLAYLGVPPQPTDPQSPSVAQR